VSLWRLLLLLLLLLIMCLLLRPWRLLPTLLCPLRVLLLLMLQVDVDRARQQVAGGDQPAGILGSLVAAEDEHGNRWEGA